MSKALILVSGQALNADFTTQPFALNNTSNYSVQFSFSGTTVSGTVVLQASTDYATGAAGTWDDIPGTSQVMSTSGHIQFNLTGQGYPYVRVSWTNSSSSSNAAVTIYMNLKSYEF